MRFAAAAVAALIFGVAAPIAAQMPPPGEMPEGYGAPRGNAQGNPMFAGMSDTGRAIMRAALKDADSRAGREATGAARDRMLAVLDADRLDAVALKRAMDDEREAATAAKVRHQAALITGFQQLSLADRRAFVVNARAMRERMASRTAGWEGRHRAGVPGAMAPPQ